MSNVKTNIRLRPLKAIRAKCLECSADQITMVKNCVSEDCSLFPYRFGTNPKRKGVSGGINNLSGSRLLGSEITKSHKTAPRSRELVQVGI